MASSTSRLPLLRTIINPFKLSALVDRSFHSATSTKILNGGGCKLNAIFSRPGHSRVTARKFHNIWARYPGVSASSDHLRDMFELFDDREKNPYLITGPEKFCNAEEDEDALYARLDMPGIAKKGLELWSVNGTLWISGHECASRALYQLEEHRIYSTNIAVPSEIYRTDQIRALLKNGVLRVVIPKVKNGDRTGSVHINVEDLPEYRRCFAPLSGHTTTSGQSFTPNLENDFHSYVHAVNLMRENPFIAKGPVSPFKLMALDHISNYTRVDMPGVGRDGVKLWIKDADLCFEGIEDEKDLSYYDKETDRRKYQGCTGLAKKFARDRNGVLRIHMPIVGGKRNRDMWMIPR